MESSSHRTKRAAVAPPTSRGTCSATAPGAAPTPARAITFRGNLAETRHGWLRLTPAYSVELVRRLLEEADTRRPVLDPFCGTGTTLLACAERGLDCDTVDVNPFLIWLADTKAADYPARALDGARRLAVAMARDANATNGAAPWLPPLSKIERWWSRDTACELGRAYTRLARSRGDAQARDLARVVFCRALIRAGQVSFGHQSMSFRRGPHTPSAVGELLVEELERVLRGAGSAVQPSARRAILGDSRALGRALGRRQYGTVITSPPYCNRMSYIRELRPYMYWLGYLTDARAAGELDWQAIGGTWGSATSRLATWSAETAAFDKPRAFARTVRQIAAHSPVLARYVDKYFCDMRRHVEALYPRVARGGRVHYVVGNSKFYDVLLSTEQLFAALFEQAGFHSVEVVTLRKRTSKRELFEYCVSAAKG